MILHLLDALGTVRLASEWWQPDHPLNHVLHVSVPPNISEAAAWHGTGVGESLPAEYPQSCNTWVQTLPQQRVLPFPGASFELRTNICFLRWPLGYPGSLTPKGT